MQVLPFCTVAGLVKYINVEAIIEFAGTAQWKKNFLCSRKLNMQRLRLTKE